jgi:outer membrane lipoprotein carrier protein
LGRASLLAALLAGAQVAGARQPPAPGTPAEFARRLQQHYSAVSDFSADFTQTYQGGALRKRTTEHGSVIVKKPGRMRWTYRSPEEKVFVSDGTKLYAYVPADRQVTVSDMPSGDEAGTPVLFLAGRGDLVRDFTAAWAEVPSAPAGSVALALTPRRREADYETLTLVVDRASLVLRMLVAVDGQGGRSTFMFSNLKENVGAPDKAFRFSIPRGVDVITRD